METEVLHPKEMWKSACVRMLQQETEIQNNCTKRFERKAFYFVPFLHMKMIMLDTMYKKIFQKEVLLT